MLLIDLLKIDCWWLIDDDDDDAVADDDDDTCYTFYLINQSINLYFRHKPIAKKTYI